MNDELRWIIIDALCRREKIEGEYAVQTTKKLYMSISEEYRHNASTTYLKACIARAEGGAWSMYATLDVQNFHTTVSIKRVNGIINHKFDMADFVFEHCDPDFPDNLITFLRKGAIRAQRAFDIGSIKDHRRRCPDIPHRRLFPRKAVQDRN